MEEEGGEVAEGGEHWGEVEVGGWEGMESGMGEISTSSGYGC